MDIRSLPKVELHLHLDCSLSFEVVSQIKPSVTRMEYDRDFIGPAKCANLTDLLIRAAKGFELMQAEEELRVVTADLFEQLKCDHVLYAEIRFAPLLHTRRGLAPKEVVEIVDDMVAKASAASGVEARLILCTLRHYTQEQSLQTAKLVDLFRGSRVVALDIAGDEAGFPIDAHIPAFQYAIDKRIPRTAHAGEARGTESVWETLRYFQPSRIGHGVRSIEDPDLIEHLRQSGIHLEVCPTSNVHIDIYDTYGDHPIDSLYRRGVSVGVNTDARTLVNITLRGEYERLHDVFGWRKEHFLACNLNAVEAAFIPDSVKRSLADRLREAYTKCHTVPA